MDFSQESQEKVHSGMKNSSANDAQSADGAARDLDADQGHPATDASGLTYASGGKRFEELPWITPRSRRANLTPKGDSQVSGVSPPSLTTNEQVFRDPFGLSEAPAYVDPAWCKRFPAARTKQSARRSVIGSFHDQDHLDSFSRTTCLRAAFAASSAAVSVGTLSPRLA